MAEAVVRAVSEYKGIKYTGSSNISDSNYYTVKKGDTLWDLAVKYKTNVKTIKDINNLKSDVLKIGQKLILPSKTYIVKKGDSLWKIAKEYGTTINDLVKLNNLKNTTLQIGQKLILS